MTAHGALARALARIAELDDPAVFISHVDRDLLRKEADRIDAAPDEAVPLRGTTFAVKDNIDTATMVTTAACPSFDRRPDRSATVVARLLAAGALPVAKTNLDQFATGLVGTRSPYGTPRNPLDAGLIPGGSSSGSAVAVARDLVTFALGTDTAGSGRVPAAMCGIYGLKPTRGWLSTTGVVPAVRSIDCVSVFARELATAWMVSTVAAGFDPDDPMSRRAPAASRAAVRTVGIVAPGALEALGVDRPVIERYRHWCSSLQGAEVAVAEVDIGPLLEIGQMLYGGPWVAERSAAVGEFVAAAPSGLDPTVAGIISAAARFSAVDAHRGLYELAGLRRRADELFEAVDVLATPTVPGVVSVDEVARNPIAANTRMGLFTTFTNLADQCALTVPLPEAVAGASVSLHGPAWADEALARFAGSITPSTSDPVCAGPPRGWITLAVAGAHLRGQPLEHQLLDRRALWMGTTTTCAAYRLYALAGTVPAKPGLVRTESGGAAIEVDLWALSPEAFASFVVVIPPPLCIGTVELADGSTVPGFLCEPRALGGAADITAFGGWRAYRSV